MTTSNVAWAANGGPTEAELREYVREGKTDQQIADLYGVKRQTVAYWRTKNHVSRGERVLLNHKHWIPWTLRVEDANDSIARQLRAYSTIQQGGEIDASAQARLDKFLKFLEENRVVVDYDRTTGFVFRPRDSKIDRRGDIIRRPVEEDS